MGNVKVIVLGTLGELVKKIVELELLERTPSRDTTVQMFAYQKIYEQWPVEDKAAVDALFNSFRIQVARHKAIENTMTVVKVEGSIGTTEWVSSTAILTGAVLRYLDSKKSLQQMMLQLNNLGKHSGLPPITMEI